MIFLLLQQWAKHRHPNKAKYWRLNIYWKVSGFKRWLFKTDKQSLINLRKIHSVRNPKLKIDKNSFIDAEYFYKRKTKLNSFTAARNGEEMLEPYERETLTYGS